MLRLIYQQETASWYNNNIIICIMFARIISYAFIKEKLNNSKVNGLVNGIKCKQLDCRCRVIFSGHTGSPVENICLSISHLGDW